MYGSCTWRTTFYALVASGEVRLELGEARIDAVERLVRQRDFTSPSAGAQRVGKTQHVGRASDETEVVLDTATEPHPSVPGRLHDDQFTSR